MIQINIGTPNPCRCEKRRVALLGRWSAGCRYLLLGLLGGCVNAELPPRPTESQSSNQATEADSGAATSSALSTVSTHDGLTTSSTLPESETASEPVDATTFTNSPSTTGEDTSETVESSYSTRDQSEGPGVEESSTTAASGHTSASDLPGVSGSATADDSATRNATTDLGVTHSDTLVAETTERDSTEGSSSVDATSSKETTPTPLSGKWEGLTSQGKRVSLKLFEGAILQIGFDWLVQAGGCTATGGTTTTLGTPLAIEEGEPFQLGPYASNPVAYTATGTVGAGGMSGTLNVSHPVPNCSGSANLTWQAGPVVCGNGSVEWPESCDDSNTTQGDGCSSVCQVDVIGESEPNDTPAEATGVPTQERSIIFSGSLEDGYDNDVFAVRNPLSGTIAFALETHGETVGVCSGGSSAVDTFIEVIDAQSNTLAADADSGRGWYCSALTYNVGAGQTVYLRVTSQDFTPIDAYTLVVTFQSH